MTLILVAGFLLAAALIFAAVVMYLRDRREGESWPEFIDGHPFVDQPHAWRVRPNVLRALRHEPGLAVYDAVCACGWQSRAYQTEAAAQLEAEQHEATAERAMS